MSDNSSIILVQSFIERHFNGRWRRRPEEGSQRGWCVRRHPSSWQDHPESCTGQMQRHCPATHTHIHIHTCTHMGPAVCCGVFEELYWSPFCCVCVCQHKSDLFLIHSQNWCSSVCVRGRVVTLEWSIYLSVCLAGWLSVFLSSCLSVCLSISLVVYLSIHPSSISLSVCLSGWLSVFLSSCLSVCLSVYLSSHLSIHHLSYISLSVCLSVCLPVCLSV